MSKNAGSDLSCARQANMLVVQEHEHFDVYLKCMASNMELECTSKSYDEHVERPPSSFRVPILYWSAKAKSTLGGPKQMCYGQAPGGSSQMLCLLSQHVELFKNRLEGTFYCFIVGVFIFFICF